jgi:hypothetical protein
MFPPTGRPIVWRNDGYQYRQLRAALLGLAKLTRKPAIVFGGTAILDSPSYCF